MIDSEVLTVMQVAQWLQISGNKVYELVARGELRCFRVGRAIRILRRDVIAFLKRMQTGQKDE